MQKVLKRKDIESENNNGTRLNEEDKGWKGGNSETISSWWRTPCEEGILFLEAGKSLV